ncbi:arabinan endo-1,5-alpha-L-arabinosidase [Salinibacterium sp. SYSU T00001]|uniref:arabinan endo-1,5-alpha-L-arabinosidase n=1 Tax=Homoserinimonas sedimenticola TaxID=2986805 RepID=UPI0022354825|nr:arabinan endo-1,5-alpha-L-arabinosidase [Salinibacterium sedimenticola]MCW4385212.1 arabinan endo-1,5-alpha-L-arabinosidase [Salinibacterium sedimenticola]
MLPAVAGAALLSVALTACSTGPQHESLELSGDLTTHDPALAIEGDDWYVYSTGNGAVADGNIQVRHSDDGEQWEYVGEVWQEKPAWVVEAVDGVDNLWAPELVRHDGTWHLYYSASTFGSNTSVIALATNETLDPDAANYEWVDRGPVIASDGDDDFNAIDPGIITDAEGTPWMAFGSFWSGLRMIELEWPSGLRVDHAEPLRLADRQTPPNAIEAPYIVERDGWYYLFFSRDSCCRGLGSTYNMAVGRSETVTGPYLDREGVPLLQDGGMSLLESEHPQIGPGGQSVARVGGVDYLAYHYYDGDRGGQFTLGIRPIEWVDGWPSID